MSEVYQLTYPAPRRCSVECGKGMYYTKPWGLKDVHNYIKAGGIFMLGFHDFESRIVTSYALSGGDVRGFSDIQLKTLRNELKRLGITE